jgi:hypothetical protein
MQKWIASLDYGRKFFSSPKDADFPKKPGLKVGIETLAHPLNQLLAVCLETVLERAWEHEFVQNVKQGIDFVH